MCARAHSNNVINVQLVIGSAVYAFEEVCGERMHLLHKHYRKLCAVLMDVDEWGQVSGISSCSSPHHPKMVQVIIINTLTRYARYNFTDANVRACLPSMHLFHYRVTKMARHKTRTSIPIRTMRMANIPVTTVRKKPNRPRRKSR